MTSLVPDRSVYEAALVVTYTKSRQIKQQLNIHMAHSQQYYK